MLKKYYKVLQPLPLYSKGNVISFNVQTINYGEEQIDKRGIGTILAFMWEFKDYYLEEIVNDPDIGELPKEIFNELKEKGQHVQLLNFVWCVIFYDTVLGSYEAHGFNNKQDMITDITWISDLSTGYTDLSFSSCYHNKKEVKVDIKHEVVVTIQD